MIRVAVVDDSPLVRMGLRTLLGSSAEMRLVGEAVDGRDGLSLLRREHPDVALVDIRMPAVDGLQLLRDVAADPSLAGCRSVVLTTFELDEYVFDALRNGASGFLLKDAEPAQILEAVRVVASGEALLSPAVTRRLITSFVARPEPRSPSLPSVAGLTEREREVVQLVGKGLSNEQIGQQLQISPATARTHVGRAMLKLDARGRAQLVVFAYESGLVGS